MMMHVCTFCDCMGARDGFVVSSLHGSSLHGSSLYGVFYEQAGTSKLGMKAVLETDTSPKQGHNVMLEM